MLAAGERDAIAVPMTPTTTIIQLTSHNNRLLALTNNGQIWWYSWPGEGNPVMWELMFDPSNPGYIPVPSGVSL